MKPRATQFELAKRNEMIRDLILEGLSHKEIVAHILATQEWGVSACLLYTSPSPRDRQKSRMPSSA